jgi:hypothetical protein
MSPGAMGPGPVVGLVIFLSIAIAGIHLIGGIFVLWLIERDKRRSGVKKMASPSKGALLLIPCMIATGLYFDARRVWILNSN